MKKVYVGYLKVSHLERAIRGEHIHAASSVKMMFLDWRTLQNELPMRWPRSALKECTSPSRNISVALHSLS